MKSLWNSRGVIGVRLSLFGGVLLLSMLVGGGCSGGLPNDCAGLQAKLDEMATDAQKNPPKTEEETEKRLKEYAQVTADVAKKMAELHCGEPKG